MMIPFMAGQSLMMGEAFGKGFQYGKRKISAMSNEEFNALTPSKLGEEIKTDYTAIIPHLGQAVKASSDFQSLVIKEIIDVIKNLPADIIGGFTGTSNPETTSTAASVYGVSGTVTDVRLGGGQRPSVGRSLTREQALAQIDAGIAWTKEQIDAAARWFMEVTGIADYERAKLEIIRKIRNPPRPVFVRESLPVPKYIPLRDRPLVTGSRPDPAYLIEINSNIANYRALVTEWAAKWLKLRRTNRDTYPAGRSKYLFDYNQAQRNVQKYRSLLADWIKKGNNYQILLRNR